MNSIDFIIKRLQEPSTWTAVAVMVGVAGYEVGVEYAVEIATSAVVIINVFWKRDSQSQ